MNKNTIELSEGLKAMYKMVQLNNPKPLISIHENGEVTFYWDAIKEKADQYLPGEYNDTSTSWAYALWKLKNAS